MATYANITDAEGAAWGFIRLGMASVSKATVFTMQDVLSLGNEARMNTPGVADGNWAWRVGAPGVFATAGAEAKKLAKLAAAFDRVAETGPQAPPTLELETETELGKGNEKETAAAGGESSK